jgi:hypothetical protein
MFAALSQFAPDLVRLLTLGSALFVTLVVGICVHELLHVVPLSFTDAEYTVSVLPNAREDSAPSTGWTALQNLVTGSLVRVEVTRVPDATPDWLLRVAALLPTLLALPLVLAVAGVVPDPIAGGDPVSTVALIALTGSGLPSPADWSVVWYGSDIAEN